MITRYDLLPVSTDLAHHAVVDPRFAYVLDDDEMAQGSTIGAPRCCTVIKPTGAIEKIFCPDAGYDFIGALEVHYWDRKSKIRLGHLHGEFHIHPERQSHVFTLDNGVRVHEQIFPYNDAWDTADDIPPPAVYYRIHLRNVGQSDVSFDAYGFCELRGNTGHDVVTAYDAGIGGIVAWNRAAPTQVRLFAMLGKADGWETNSDRGKVVGRFSPGKLADDSSAQDGDPIGVLHSAIDLAPGEARWLDFLCVFAESRDDLAASVARCPSSDEASRRTTQYYWQFLRRSVLRTPSVDVNHGVLWAKANILRVATYAPTGWCFTNDPTRSNNSVGRDTAWMTFGADYLNPDFAREALSAYFRLQEPSGKIVEYYDVRNDRCEDDGLNVNDDTPLVVIALAHHLTATGDEAFARRFYPNAVRAMQYMLSQRNDDGLVWCSATETAERGIVGWRNIIPNYRISGASTEVNSACYAALMAIAALGRRFDDPNAATYQAEAEALRDAINTHLVNPDNDLYLLNIDVDGSRRTDVTADLIFPVLFGVAPPERAAGIINALSVASFWTDAGIRTVPREAIDYGPVKAFGLLGGVWVAVSYWFAFAAASHQPSVMARALATSFHHFSIDPRRNNTVPGQFSEWLHGEILSNQGMMLSPWDAPRYLWAAIEGAGGLHIMREEAEIAPALADDWRWLTAVNVPFRGKSIAWVACRMPDGLHVHTTATLPSPAKKTTYARDATDGVHISDPEATVVALAGDEGVFIFVGNSGERTTVSAVAYSADEAGECSVRVFSTVWNEWQDKGRSGKATIEAGIPIVIDAGGFAIIKLRPVSAS